MGHERKEIRVLSARYPKLQTLINYVNVDTLRAFHNFASRSVEAIEIEKEAIKEYHKNLENNLLDLISRMKDFSYRPRKLYNDETKQIECLYEDRLVEGCMTYVLYEVYEPRFLQFTHADVKHANLIVNKTIDMENVKYVLECTIQDIFLNIQIDELLSFIRNDISDENFIRYINRFLHSGILRTFDCAKKDNACRSFMAPILAEVYLHYIVDIWFEKTLAKELHGVSKIVRFKDQLVFLFEHEETARTVYKILNMRLRDYSLGLSNCKAKILPEKHIINTLQLSWFNSASFSHGPLNAKI